MLINKYSKLYYTITNNAKQRVTDGYTERHHIIPQSLGGNNDKENLVDLTAREHFICHWLLIKMTDGEDRSKMLYALNGMRAENKHQERYHTKITARVYEKYRLEHAKNHSEIMKGRVPYNKGRKMSEEQKELLRGKARANHASGKVYSVESQKKRISKVTGQKRSEETRKKMSLAQAGKSKGPMSEEQKIKISLNSKGVKKKEGHSKNVADAVRGNVSINKDGIEKKVKRDVLDQFLSQGWMLGGRKRI